MVRSQDDSAELTPDLLNDIARANPRRLETWSQEFERTGRVVLRTSLLKTLGTAAVSWLFVAALVTMFVVTPVTRWNPQSDDFAGWGLLLCGVLFVIGLFLFGFGAVTWGFVYPVIRPRTIVSRWGVETLGWKPGGTFTLFQAAWPDIVRIGGTYTAMKWPFPSVLRVTITAQGDSVRRGSLLRIRTGPDEVIETVSWMLRGRPRDVLAFLVGVRDGVGS